MDAEIIFHSGQHIEVIVYDQYRNSASATSTMTQVVDTPAQVAESFALLPNYPNQFNPETEISYRLPASGVYLYRLEAAYQDNRDVSSAKMTLIRC